MNLRQERELERQAQSIEKGIENKLAQEIKESQLMEEKYLVVKELINHIHHAQFDRKTLTSEMLKELRNKIDEMLKNDF